MIIRTIWLWRDGDELVCYRDQYPKLENGDPAVLGEPVGQINVFDGEQPPDGARIPAGLDRLNHLLDTLADIGRLQKGV